MKRDKDLKRFFTAAVKPVWEYGVLNAVFGRADKKLENDGIKDNSD